MRHVMLVVVLLLVLMAVKFEAQAGKEKKNLLIAHAKILCKDLFLTNMASCVPSIKEKLQDMRIFPISYEHVESRSLHRTLIS